MQKEMKVFLGGTCNGSFWRETLMPMLDVEYFNPVVKDWTPECQKEEERQKEICAIHLYVITSDMVGVFSIAEVVDSAHRNPKGTILCVIGHGFDKAQLKSLQATAKLVKNVGATFVESLESVAIGLNLIAKNELPEEIKAKTLHNTDTSKAQVNVKDIIFWGDGSMFKLLSKASSKNEGWMKSTKAMEIPHVGCIVQVTTQQGDNVSEALTYVPDVSIKEHGKDNKILFRELVSTKK